MWLLLLWAQMRWSQPRRVEAIPRLEFRCWLWIICSSGGWLHCLEPFGTWPAWSALKSSSVPRPWRAKTVTSLSVPEHPVHMFLVNICSHFPLRFNLIQKVPSPALSYPFSWNVPFQVEMNQWNAFLSFYFWAGFYVARSVLIHLTNVYVLTACQPSTRHWGMGILMVLTPFGCCED